MFGLVLGLLQFLQIPIIPLKLPEIMKSPHLSLHPFLGCFTPILLKLFTLFANVAVLCEFACSPCVCVGSLPPTVQTHIL